MSRTATLESLPAPARRVVDAPIRMFHALFAASFTLAYLTGDGERFRALHVALGWTMLGLLAFRLVYGLIGPRPARLAPLVRQAARLPGWVREMVRRPSLAAARWRSVQREATAASVAGLLSLTVPLVASGWLFHVDAAGEWLAEVHEALGSTMLALVAAHLAVLALAGLVRRRNVIRPMLDGRIDGPGPDLLPDDRRGLAAVLLASVVLFVTGSLLGLF